MKKRLFMMVVVAMVLQHTGLNAQVPDIPLNEAGAYEKKEVVEVEGASSAVLFGRAMEALSDWTGPDGKAKVGIDYQDKETGTVIYKGKYYLGLYRVLLTGIEMYADVVLKVRCKDGRAQVTVTIPMMTGIYSNGQTRQASIGETVESMKEKGAKKRPSHEFLPKIPAVGEVLMKAMIGRLNVKVDDDDF